MDSLECLPPELERFWRTDDGLTACEWAEAYGIDLSLLDANLRLTAGERLRRNDARLNAGEHLVAKCIAGCRSLGIDDVAILEWMTDRLVAPAAESGR